MGPTDWDNILFLHFVATASPSERHLHADVGLNCSHFYDRPLSWQTDTQVAHANCKDLGIPVFEVAHAKCWSHLDIKEERSTRELSSVLWTFVEAPISRRRSHALQPRQLA
jgi:hypothetical protein